MSDHVLFGRENLTIMDIERIKCVYFAITIMHFREIHTNEDV